MFKYSSIWNIFKRDNLRSPDADVLEHVDYSPERYQIRPLSKSIRGIRHIPRKVEGRLLRKRTHVPAATCCSCVLRASPVHGLWAQIQFWALDHVKDRGKRDKHEGYKELLRYLGCLLVKNIKIPDLGGS